MQRFQSEQNGKVISHYGQIQEYFGRHCLKERHLIEQATITVDENEANQCYESYITWSYVLVQLRAVDHERMGPKTLKTNLPECDNDPFEH